MTNSILFLCVANSARSQMAEGLARAMAPAGTKVFSAGSEPDRLNPLAARALAEVEIDPAGHHSKGIAEIPLEHVQTVVTLCEEEVCPPVPEGTLCLHWPMPDPAAEQGTEAERLNAFRLVRDQIRDRLAHGFGWTP